MASNTVNRYLVRCCYCRQTFAVEGVAPWHMSPTDASTLVQTHARTCPKTTQRIMFRSYGTTNRARLDGAAYDVLTADWRITQVRGTYTADIRCNSRCTHAKGGNCQCECGGRNHGSGLVLTEHVIA